MKFIYIDFIKAALTILAAVRNWKDFVWREIWSFTGSNFHKPQSHYFETKTEVQEQA